MITLGALKLGRGLRWVEEGEYTGVAQAMRRTVGGKPFIYSRTRTGAMPITLASEADMGIVTYAVVKELQKMASDPTGCYTLAIKDREFSVYFRNYEPPAIQWVPIIPRTVPLDDDYVKLTLKLVTYAH